MPIVLYECETWLLTLREEHRLRVFENRMLRGIFGPKRDEVTGEWRKLHNEEVNDLYYLPNIVQMIKSRRMRLAGHVALCWRGELYTGFWWGNLREGDHLEDPDIGGRIIGSGMWGMDWIDLPRDRDRWQALVNVIMNL